MSVINIPPVEEFFAFSALCRAHADFVFNARLISRNPSQHTALAESLMKTQIEVTARSATKLAERLVDHPSSYRDAIASLCPSALSLYSPMPAGRIHLEPAQWTILLDVATPEEFDLMVSRGLGLGICGLHVFQGLVQRSHQSLTDAQRIARTIAEKIGPMELARHADKTCAWDTLTLPLPRTPLAAGYIRAQVRAFPETFRGSLAMNIADMSVDMLLILHLAGLSPSMFPARSKGPARLSQLLEQLQSAHGRLAIGSRTGTLEQYLSGPATDRWA